MRRALRKLYRPEVFQVDHRRPGSFEGWYFKVAFESAAWAFIPGVSLARGDEHAFVQVLDGTAGSATYARYAVSDFDFVDAPFEVAVGPSRFGLRGVRVDAEGMRAELRFDELRRWPSSLLWPGAMGWYAFVPFMQCNHGVIALDGEVSGTVNGARLEGGRVYIEKDWGTSFPQAWVWAQTNSFGPGREGCSLTCSIATVPWVRGRFTGFIVALLEGGRLHRFTTYTGARLEGVRAFDDRVEVALVRGRERLELVLRRGAGADLRSPLRGQMEGRVNESLAASVDVRLLDGGREVFAGTGRWAGLEVVDPDALAPG
jgi:hypothetical protein